MTPKGIESTTFWFIAQFLKQLSRCRMRVFCAIKLPLSKGLSVSFKFFLISLSNIHLDHQRACFPSIVAPKLRTNFSSLPHACCTTPHYKFLHLIILIILVKFLIMHFSHLYCFVCLYGLNQCFSTFVRPRPGKFFFYKTRARFQQIY